MIVEIAHKSFGKIRERMVLGEKRFTQPGITVESDSFSSELSWTFSANGFQGTGVAISAEMFDALKELVNDYRVVEYYEQLRTQRNTGE